MKSIPRVGGKFLAAGLLLSTGLTLTSTTANAYFGSPGNQVAVKKSANTSPYGYYEYLPANYADAAVQSFPVVLFLHGIGEEGNGEADLSRNLANGPPQLANKGQDFPALVFSPQSPVWWNSATIDQFVSYIFAKYPGADPKRLYVTGLSMGGGGTWDYATAHPERVAAIVPICGASGGIAARKVLYGKGIWAFHDFDDPTVGVSNTISNIDTVAPTEPGIMTGYPYQSGGKAATTDMMAVYSQKQNSHTWSTGNTYNSLDHDTSIRFTLYQAGGHNAWSRAYANPDMWNWLYTWRNDGAVVQPPQPSPSPKPSPSPTAAPIAFSAGSIQIEFGAGGVAGINNVTNGAPSVVSGLINQDQKPTTAKLSIVKGFNGVNGNGTTAPAASTGVPAGAARDSFFGNDQPFGAGLFPAAQLELSGLDASKYYDFSFFASRMGAGGDNREAEYQVVGSNSGLADLNASENTASVASVKGIRPDANGKVLLNVKKGAKNNNSYGFYYLGYLKVAVGAAPSTPTPSPSPSAPPAAARTMAVDFGAGGTLPAGWNDGRGLARSGTLALKASDGSATKFSLATVVGFNSTNANGTSAPAAALGLPAVCAQDSFFGNDQAFNGGVFPKAAMEVRGLDPTKSYTLEFFASRMTTDKDSRQTLYTAIGGSTVSATLEVLNNVSGIASLSVKPNASGVVRIEIAKGPQNTNPYGFFYLGSLRIRE